MENSEVFAIEAWLLFDCYDIVIVVAVVILLRQSLSCAFEIFAMNVTVLL